jgi:hypothetical protein
MTWKTFGEPSDLFIEVAQYRNQPQITRKGAFGITGQTNSGENILFPDSFQRGYEYELTPPKQRPKKQSETLGLVMTTSDGHMNFLPSFNAGRETAKEVKTQAIVTKIKQLDAENISLKNTVENLSLKLDGLMNEKK